MDNENNLGEKTPLPPITVSGADALQNATLGTGQRIQFIPSTSPDRGRSANGKEDAVTFVAPIRQRSRSVHSIPQVISEKDKKRRKIEKEEEKKHIDIDEHLKPHQDVAERYKTGINMDKPEESLGLTGEQAELLLREHGPNILTPPKTKHW
jgi:sodium/potassium-transporting ATPase subunit alpha